MAQRRLARTAWKWVPAAAATAGTATMTWFQQHQAESTAGTHDNDNNNGSSNENNNNIPQMLFSSSLMASGAHITHCEAETATTATAAPRQLATSSAVAAVSGTASGTTTTSATSNKNRLIFLGTGSSSGCPMPRCPVLFSNANPTDPDLTAYQAMIARKCQISNLTLQHLDPRDNPDYRNNPCMVISVTTATTTRGTESDNDNDDTTVVEQQKNIIIDVGKTFREAALRWFPVRDITSLDAVILTHEHADASFGLDDLRGFQKFDLVKRDRKGRFQQLPMPIHLSQQCLDDVATRFTWLFPYHQPPKPKDNDDDKAVQATSPRTTTYCEDCRPKPAVERHVASLDVQVFTPFQPFRVADALDVIPLPVLHGEDFVSFGFAFTVGTTNVLYLSDISRMLPETMDFIQRELPPTDVLVIDALHPTKAHPVHYSMKQAIELAQQIQPRRQTLMVGMNCDSFLPHELQNEELAKTYGTTSGASGDDDTTTNGPPFFAIQLARDGLVVDC